MSALDTADSFVAGFPLAEAVFDAGYAVSDNSVLGFGGAVVSGAREVSGFADDPIGSFFASGVGWVIEHLPPLKLALDAVSGDPDAIKALNQAWTDDVAEPLAGVAQDVRAAAAATSPGWTGVDADAYRAATVELAAHGAALASAARTTAAGASMAGAMVVEVRNTIRDELAKFLVWVVATEAAGAAASGPTWGSSVVAATNAILLRGSALATKFAGLLERLATKLQALASRFSALNSAVAALRRAGTKFDGLSESVVRAVDGGIVTRTAEKLSEAGPVSPLRELAGPGALAGVKVMGDGWSAWTGAKPA